MRFIILSFLSTTFIASTSLAGLLVLSPRKSLQLPAAPASEIHVENGAILQIKEAADHIQVVAKKIGRSQLRIDRRIYRIEVVPLRAYETYEALRPALDPPLRLEVSQQKIFITGALPSIAAWENVSRLPKVLQDFHWKVSMNENIRDELRADLNRRFRAAGLPPLNLVSEPTLQAVLPLELKDLHARYEALLAPLGVTALPDPAALYASPLIELSVVIAEVKKGFLQSFGLQWPSELKAQVVPEFQWQTSEAALFRLDAVEARGQGKVLAAPRLLCRSGRKASFMSGGEIPIRTGGLSGEVIWKKHGILLEFQPTVDTSNLLHLNVQTEISSPDFATAVNGLPGFLTNRISTDFILKEPRPILISGLFKKDTRNNTQGLPWLSRIPILGVLFSSRDFQENLTELIILVSPKVSETSETEGA